ncbi:MAG: hypothetical protein AB9879_09850 [Methanothrix sp.]
MKANSSCPFFGGACLCKIPEMGLAFVGADPPGAVVDAMQMASFL